MKSLKIYKVTEKYIAYLHKWDYRVQYNKSERRPYVGVVLYVGDFRYFVPMESPKENHKTIKPGKHIMSLDEGRLGLLGFNNMIPVDEKGLIEFDINSVENKSYRLLLQKQAAYINKHKAEIFNHAAQTYYDTVNGKNKFLLKICCDFKRLERACLKYDDKR